MSVQEVRPHICLQRYKQPRIRGVFTERGP